MSDTETPRDDAQDDENNETMEPLRRKEIPESAHVSACGLVVDDEGNTLGKIESGGSRSIGSNPKGRDGENTSIAGCVADETEGSW
jgi:hypothetical protein